MACRHCQLRKEGGGLATDDKFGAIVGLTSRAPLSQIPMWALGNVLGGNSTLR